MLNATDAIPEKAPVDVLVLSKPYLLGLGRCRIQSLITEMASDDLHKLYTALCISQVSNPLPRETMMVAILEAFPNEHVSRKALLSDGVDALPARLCNATLVRPTRKAPHTLLRERKPGLLRVCAKALGVKLHVKRHYKSEEQVRAEILQAVEAHVSNREGIAHTDSPRLTELRRLPKDPPKTKKLSATGFNGVRCYSVIEILRSYGLQSKHNDCAFTKAAMIDSILRHEATLEYKGNLDHDDWRSSREAELILLPLNGEQLSLRALMSQYHIRLAITGSSREQAVAAILCYECPETLRQACFQIFWRDHQRLPTSGCQCRAENAYAAYLDCSLHRRYAAYRGKAALIDDEIRSWDVIF